LAKLIGDPLVVFNAQQIDPARKLSNLIPKWIVIENGAILSCDTKNVAVNQPSEESLEVAEESQNVDTEMDIIHEEERKVAEKVVLPPPKKEYPTPRMIYKLKGMLARAKARVGILSEKEKFQRATERQMAEMQVCRLSAEALFYLEEVCPALLDFSKLLERVERFLADAKVRIINIFIICNINIDFIVKCSR